MVEARHFVFITPVTGGVLTTRERCERHGVVTRAATVAEGRKMLELPRRYAGILLWTALAGDSPLDLLELARTRNPLAPIAILARRREAVPEVLLQRYRATRLAWEASAAEIEPFLLDAALIGATDDPVLHAVKRALVFEHGLDIRETEVLTLALDRVPRDDWPGLLRRKDSTIKHKITSLLRKVEVRSLREVAALVQARAGTHAHTLRREGGDLRGEGRDLPTARW